MLTCANLHAEKQNQNKERRQTKRCICSARMEGTEPGCFGGKRMRLAAGNARQGLGKTHVPPGWPGSTQAATCRTPVAGEGRGQAASLALLCQKPAGTLHSVSPGHGCPLFCLSCHSRLSTAISCPYQWCSLAKQAVSGDTGLSCKAGERPATGDPAGLPAAERRRGGRGGGLECPPSRSGPLPQVEYPFSRTAGFSWTGSKAGLERCRFLPEDLRGDLRQAAKLVQASSSCFSSSRTTSRM